MPIVTIVLEGSTTTRAAETYTIRSFNSRSPLRETSLETKFIYIYYLVICLLNCKPDHGRPYICRQTTFQPYSTAVLTLPEFHTLPICPSAMHR